MTPPTQNWIPIQEHTWKAGEEVLVAIRCIDGWFFDMVELNQNGDLIGCVKNTVKKAECNFLRDQIDFVAKINPLTFKDLKID
jgi:hypothetical protein